MKELTTKICDAKRLLYCWDGRYKGEMQDAGGYVYMIKAVSACANIFKKGMVLLVK